MSAPVGRLSMGGPNEPDPLVKIVCDEPNEFHRRKGRSVVGVLRSDERWDGQGRYWGLQLEMSRAERERWKSVFGYRSAAPRPRREAEGAGFRYVRDESLVESGEEGNAITNAMHHGTGPGRRGVPEPGVLDGVHRTFEMPGCACGAPPIRARGQVVAQVLDGFFRAGVTTIPLELLREAVTRERSTG